MAAKRAKAQRASNIENTRGEKINSITKYHGSNSIAPNTQPSAAEKVYKNEEKKKRIGAEFNFRLMLPNEIVRIALSV